MKTRKIAVNWFVDFDKEEQWLNDMVAKGWDFYRTSGVIYRFKKCTPGEYIYQIDFKEKKSKDEVADYISFRSSCEDQLAHQWKSKIYWKRNAAAGPFEAENNIAAKLRLTNKAFQFHLNSFIGLTLIAAFAFLVLMPLGRHLSGCCFAKWLTDFSTGLTYGILAAILLILFPILKKLNKKINDLISEIF